jgi:hypothetical protein
VQTNNLPTPAYYHIIHESDITNGIIPDTFKNNIVELSVGNLDEDGSNQVSVNEADEIFDINPSYNPPLVYRVKTERLVSLIIDALYNTAVGKDNIINSFSVHTLPQSPPAPITSVKALVAERNNVIANTEVHIKILVNLTKEDLTFLKLRGATLNLESRPDYINTITEALTFGIARTQNKNRRTKA